MPAKISTISTIIVIALLFTIFSNVIFAEKFGKISKEEWNITPPAEEPNAGAVVIFEHGELDININEITLKHHVRVKVFKKNIADNVINVELPFYKRDKVYGFKAHTITPDGKKHKVKDKYEKTTKRNKIISFTFPAISDNVILEYKYEQVHHRYWLLDTWYFQNPVITMESEYKVTLHGSFKYNIIKRSLPNDIADNIDDVEEVRNNKFSWNLKDIPAAKDEPLTGAKSSYEMSIFCQLISFNGLQSVISFIESWSDLGEPLTKYINKFIDAKGNISSLANTICASENDPNQKVRLLFEYVRDEFETRDDYNGFNFNKKDINELLEDGYGNVAEKNALLIALIRAIGIDANPLLLGTRDFSLFDPNAHLLSQFNHMVCHIENDSVTPIILDTDEKTTIYPFLPTRSIVSGGLLLVGKDSHPIDVKHVKRKNDYNIYSQVSLQQDGSAICTTFASVKGYNMIVLEKYFIDSLPPEELISVFYDYDDEQIEIIKLEKSRDDVGDSIYFNFIIIIPEFATVVDNNLFFPSSLGNQSNSLFISDKRSFPVDFRFSFAVNYVTIFSYPENAIVSDIPADISISSSSSMLRISRYTFKTLNSIKVDKKLTIGKSVVFPAEYPDLKNIMDSYYESATDQIAVTMNK